MKKIIITAFGIVVLGTICFLIYKISQKHSQNQAIALKKHILPDFQLYSQDLQRFSASQLKRETPICIFYYNAGCEHCQYEAKQLNKNINSFRDVQVVMVSVNNPEEVTAFAKTYKLDKYPYITWLYDKDYEFYKWFGHTVTPSVFIYNAEHTLLKEYRGEVKVESVLKYFTDGKKS